MAHYTTKCFCKNCGQAYSVLIFFHYIDTDQYDEVEMYDRKVYRTNQEPSGRYIEDPKQNGTGFFCDYCGVWNDDDDYE